MPFCHPFTLRTNSRDAQQALVPHKRIGAKAGVPYDQAQFIVLFPRAIFLQRIFLRKITRPTRCPRYLTEFPFAHNFSRPDGEGL